MSLKSWQLLADKIMNCSFSEECNGGVNPTQMRSYS